MRLLQISDTHIFADPQEKLLGINTAESFQATLAMASHSSPGPDAIVLTGDLSQDESESAYVNLVQMIEKFQFNCPIYWLPGNHDDPACLEKIFTQKHAGLKNQWDASKTFFLGDWIGVLANTHYPGHVEGLLSQNELCHIDQSLSAHPQQPALIFMHHPPIAVHSEWLDQLSLKNAEAFFEVIDSYPNVKGIICGHVHQNYHAVRKNVSIFTAPSTCIQFKPSSPVFALDTQNPGYRWIDLCADKKFNTGIERLSKFKTSIDICSKGY